MCRCVDAADGSIPTPLKHIFQSIGVTNDGHLISATGGSFAPKWPAVASTVAACAQSLVVTA